MGLEIVELVLETERHFSIDLPDKELEDILTVESYCQLIRTQCLLKNGFSGSDSAPNYSVIYQYVVSFLSIDYGVPISDIHPHSWFVQDLGLD